MENISKTLDERQKTHGDFYDVAETAETITQAIEIGASYERMSNAHRFALKNIAGKIARIADGNPLEPDHWHDIAGYATLAEKECPKRESTGDSQSRDAAIKSLAECLQEMFDLKEHLKDADIKISVVDRAISLSASVIDQNELNSIILAFEHFSIGFTRNSITLSDGFVLSIPKGFFIDKKSVRQKISITMSFHTKK